MNSFAEACVITALAPAALLAQGATMPAAVTARVADSLAARWSVSPADVRIEWGYVVAAPDSATPFRLVGRGDDGMLVAVFDDTATPVAVRLRAGTSAVTPVAARDLASGVALTADDIVLAPSERWGPPKTDTVAVDAGWVTRRALRRGEPLTPPAIGAPILVRPGDPVQVEWRQGAVAVAMSGVAQNAAALGETVHVRLPGRSGQRTATMTAPGLARLDR
jgi:flagella basal body P-ring formation protein FlgA